MQYVRIKYAKMISIDLSICVKEICRGRVVDGIFTLFTLKLTQKFVSFRFSYNWSRSILFYDRNGQQQVSGLHTCFLMMTSLGKQMRNENMTFAQYSMNEKVQNRSEEMKREIGNKNSGKFLFFFFLFEHKRLSLT